MQRAFAKFRCHGSNDSDFGPDAAGTARQIPNPEACLGRENGPLLAGQDLGRDGG